MQVTDRRAHVSSTVVGAELDGETVLLDVETGIYFGLDAVGTEIWKLLEQNLSEAEIHARLIQEYDVDWSVLRSDIATFLDLLAEHGLVDIQRP